MTITDARSTIPTMRDSHACVTNAVMFSEANSLQFAEAVMKILPSTTDCPGRPHPGKFRIYLVEDHPVTRKGLVRIINQESQFEVCGEAATAAQALAEIEKIRPDLVIVDISLQGGEDGLSLIQQLTGRCPGLLTMVHSTHPEKFYAERALRAGAKGYLMKTEPAECLIQGMQKILQGQTFLSREMQEHLLQRRFKKQISPGAPENECLSVRELQIYRLIGQGCKTRQIALNLHLSISTVETHRAHIKEKLHIDNAAKLLRHAVEWVRTHTN